MSYQSLQTIQNLFQNLAQVAVAVFCGILICAPSVQAKTAQLGKVTATVEISNQVPGLEVKLTGADTFLACSTKFSEGGGESGSERNSIVPETQIGVRGALKPGASAEILVSFQKEEKLSSPSRFFYFSKNCELSLGLAFDVIDSATKKVIGNVPLMYGAGLNVNEGFPLVSTAITGAGSLVIDKDFKVSYQLKSTYAGTRYSVETGGHVPYCELRLYETRNGQEYVMGLSFLELPQANCIVP